MQPNGNVSEVKVELPAEVGTKLIERGLAGSARSTERSPAEVADLAVSIVGAVGPVIVVAVADGATKAALREVWRLLISSWRRHHEKERFAIEVRRGDGRVTVKVDVSGTSPEETASELLSAVDRVLTERSGTE